MPPVKNTKAKGQKRVYKTRERLREVGYYRFVISTASLGPFDMEAWGTRDVRLIQVKSNRWPSRDEMNKITEAELPNLGGLTEHIFLKEVWMWKDRARAPRIKRLIKGEWKEIQPPT